jgi:hypothetical protein
MAQIDNDGKIVYTRITESTVVQANYLASRQDEYFVDDAINWYTGLMPWNWGTPPISHTEIGFWLDGKLWFFSSTSRKDLGGGTGTRWMPANEMLHNPERWKLQEKELPELNGGCFEISCKVDRANQLIGLAYDMYGVIADFVNPVRVCIKHYMLAVVDNIKKIYCSKAVHAVDTGELAVMSPKRRYKVAKEDGYEDVPLSTRLWCKDKGIDTKSLGSE